MFSTSVFVAHKIRWHQKKWEEANAYLSEAIGINPQVGKYYYARAVTYSNLNDFSSAVSDLKKCIDSAPYFERAHLALAAAYYHLGDFEKSRDEFFLAGQLMRSQRAQILNALVPVYVGLKQPDKAVEAGKEAVSLDPGNARYHYDLACAYVIGEQYQRAAEECRLAVNLKPDFAPAKELLEQVTKFNDPP